MLKAVSMPSFICRPSSLEGPEKGAAMPNRISLSVTPRTAVADLKGDHSSVEAMSEDAKRTVRGGSPTAGGAVGGEEAIVSKASLASRPVLSSAASDPSLDAEA